jgi:hypothetical protein
VIHAERNLQLTILILLVGIAGFQPATRLLRGCQDRLEIISMLAGARCTKMVLPLRTLRFSSRFAKLSLSLLGPVPSSVVGSKHNALVGVCPLHLQAMRRRHRIMESTLMQYMVSSALALRLDQIGLRHHFAVACDYALVLLNQLLTNKDLKQIYRQRIEFLLQRAGLCTRAVCNT